MAELRTAKIQIVLDAVIVRPGDTLVLRFHQELTPEEAAEIKQRLAEYMPDVSAVILNAEQMLVYRPNDDPTE